MDPNQVLESIRRVLGRYAEGTEDGHTEEDLVVAARALDEWLSKGGFLPEAWCLGRNADRVSSGLT